MDNLSRKDQLWLWLNGVIGHHVLLFEQLLSTYNEVEEIYMLAQKRKISMFLRWGEAFAEHICAAANETQIECQINWLKTNTTSILPLYSSKYPELLKEINHPPSLLYVKGKLDASPKLPIAIIGMRKSTPYGEAIALHLGAELTKSGATIVSGLARGIDSLAAKGALSVEAALFPTVAVLGCGIDIIYPSSNARLYYEIIERGAVVSEFLPGTRPYRENFPIRNRVISGLSRGVVIVEAASRSGTTITANHALDQNRDVFAVPGRITDESSAGPNLMIQQGEAKPIFCAADILCEYGLTACPAKPSARPDLTGLTQAQRLVVEQLTSGEKSADELCENLSLPIAEVNSTLTSLQFSGIIKQLPGRVFGL